MSTKHYPYHGGSFDRIVFDGDGSVWVRESENAKLRELVQDFWTDMNSCHLNGDVPDEYDLAFYAPRVHEFGVYDISEHPDDEIASLRSREAQSDGERHSVHLVCTSPCYGDDGDGGLKVTAEVGSKWLLSRRSTTSRMRLVSLDEARVIETHVGTLAACLEPMSSEGQGDA
jgi:hypothetical protein